MRANISKKALWITRTAVLVAMLVILQMASSLISGGNQFVTGSVVNMALIVAVMIGGLPTGLSVAVVSPVMAKLLCIGPFWSIIPFIIAGNMMLTIVWHIIGNKKTGNKYIAQVIALLAAAVFKFLVLYFGIVKIAVPLILKLPEQQASAVSAIFSLPQLITASIGGALAIVVLATLNKAIPKKDR